MQYLIQIAVWILMAYLTYRVAKRNGRDTIQAFMLGMVGGIFTLIVYWIIGPTRQERIRRSLEINKDN